VGFKTREDFVMAVARLEVKTQFEPRGGEQSFQCREGRLPQVAFVRGDHCCWDPGSVAQLLLGKAGLQSSED
jgi:hypothetical protein